jgi:hypothetical protein
MSESKNIFDETISSLKLYYWFSIAAVVPLFLLLISKILTIKVEGAEVSVTLERYAIVITILAIPAALKLFVEILKKTSPESDNATVIKRYKRASVIRLLIINAVTLMNIALYAISGNMNFFWFTIILFIIYYFCRPSYPELTGLTEKGEQKKPLRNEIQEINKANEADEENTLEWRLSVFNAPDDSLREYRIGNDLIRYYGDFGLDAFAKGWSYSMNMEAKSQLFNSYPTNSNQLRSALLSPLYVNAGVGLKFNLDKKSEKVRGRRVRWDLALAPISLNFKYVSNDSVDVVRFGIPENKKYNLDMGTTVTSILKYDITRYITWDSRLTYFTSYDKVEAEFENSLNMALSNAFSTRIYLNVRFDDGVPPHPDLKYLQYNQTLSFGLNYKW